MKVLAGEQRNSQKVNRITCSSSRVLANQCHSTRVVAACLLRTRYCLSASGVNQLKKKKCSNIYLCGGNLEEGVPG